MSGIKKPHPVTHAIRAGGKGDKRSMCGKAGKRSGKLERIDCGLCLRILHGSVGKPAGARAPELDKVHAADKAECEKRCPPAKPRPAGLLGSLRAPVRISPVESYVARCEGCNTTSNRTLATATVALEWAIAHECPK